MPAYSACTYDMVANNIKEQMNINNQSDFSDLIKLFVVRFAQDNSKFLTAKFIRACVPKHLENDPRWVNLITELLLREKGR